VQVLSPLQAAVLCVQALADDISPLDISKLVAVERGLIEAPPRTAS
jgi:hypothetical protein